MSKKLLSALILNICIGVTIQSEDIATEKLKGILNKMGMPTTPSAGTYYDVRHDGEKILIVSYKNHLQKDQQAISPHIAHVLNKKDSTSAQKEEADFICYSTITKLKEEPTKESLEAKFIPQNKHYIFNRVTTLVVSLFWGKILTPYLPQVDINVDGKIKRKPNWYASFTSYELRHIFIYHLNFWLLKHFIDNHNENKFEEQLKQKAFFNLGNHSENKDYSHLFEKDSPYSPYKKYFEKGRKEKEKNSIKRKSKL